MGNGLGLENFNEVVTQSEVSKGGGFVRRHGADIPFLLGSYSYTRAKQSREKAEQLTVETVLDRTHRLAEFALMLIVSLRFARLCKERARNYGFTTVLR